MELERIDFWPVMTKERREAQIIQHPASKTQMCWRITEEGRRKRKENEQKKMDQHEQADICPCKVKLHKCLVPNKQNSAAFRDIFVDVMNNSKVRYSFCEKIVNQIYQ